MRRPIKLVIIGAVLLALAFAADEKDARALPDGAGKDLVVRVCLDCHGSANFRKKRLNRDDWADQVGDMVDRGANAKDDEVAAIVDYLVRNFGTDSKVNVNTAPLVELKSILGFTVVEAQALMDYREANGGFKEWQDLKKVSGVDGKKIEEKRDLMAF